MIDSYIPSLPVSLYIHVPFCRKRCDYCAFYSNVYNKEKIDSFYSVLSLELERVVEEIHKPFYTIYFGGGNPMLLGVDRIKTLLEKAARYGRSEECTIEVNPEDVSSSLESLYPLVDRISTGIQTMKDSTLCVLGRRGNVKDNIKALEYLSSSPFNWNSDIMTAVPGTEIDDTLYDLEAVVKYKPDHISFYCLTFEENTPLVERERPLGENKEREYLMKGWEYLEKEGYEHYEISAFSRPGRESKHNKVYWNLGQYIGLGPSAESFLGFKNGTSMRNTESIEEYIHSPFFNCENLSVNETEESFLLTALRTKRGINKTNYRERFSFDFDLRYSPAIERLEEKWYVDDAFSFRLTEEGMMMNDRIILTLSMVI